MSVSLAKESDTRVTLTPLLVETNRELTFRLWLDSWEGPLPSQTRDDLDHNDLNGLSNVLYLRHLLSG